MISSQKPIFSSEVLFIGNMIRLSPLVGVCGVVIASFNRAFYFKIQDQIVCIAPNDSERGPFVLNSRVPKKNSWIASGIKVGDKINYRNDIFYLNNFRFYVSNACIWFPKTSRTNVFPLAIQKNLRYLRLARKTSGFKRFVFEYAFDPIVKLKKWLKEAFLAPQDCIPQLPKEVKVLVGLGPGLTPSGDDLLGGVLIVLSFIGKPEIALKLWAAIMKTILVSTNMISQSYLVAASQGNGAESIHRFLDSFFGGKPEEIVQMRELVVKIGHTSGSDILIGCQIALEAWVKTDKSRFKESKG